MGVTLDDSAAWKLIETAHTGILTTTRRDGRPIALPVWFAVIDRRIYVRTPAGAAKLARLRRDPRCAFLVEQGRHWSELAAVSVDALATIVDDEAERERAAGTLDALYTAFRPARETLPRATRAHYAEAVIIRLDPTGTSVSWDNSRLRLLRG